MVAVGKALMYEESCGLVVFDDLTIGLYNFSVLGLDGFTT
jgi:hypothetical protein